MTDLPRGWSRTTLAELGNGRRPAVKAGPFGSALKKEFYTKTGYRVYGQEQVIADNFDVGDYFIDQERFERLRACEVKPGDVLVSLVGTFGKASVVPNGVHPGIINPRLIRLSLDQQLVEPQFLRRFLGSPATQQRFEAVAHGGTMGVLNATTIGPLPLMLPPLNEQRRIVAKLEALQARSSRAREALDAVPPLLEKLRQSILAAAFRGDLTKDWRSKHEDVEPASELLKRIRIERRKKWEEAELAKMKAKGKAPTDDKWKAKYKEPEPVDATGLPELPEGWCWVNVGQLAWSVKDGPHHSPKYSDCGIPFISGRNVRPEGIDFSTAKFISEELNAEYAERCKPELNDVLYTKGGTTGIARVNTYDVVFNVWVHVAVLKLSAAVLPFYLQHALNSPHCYQQAQTLTHGVGNQDLGLTRMVNITLALAPKGEQVEIVRLLDAWSDRMRVLSGNLGTAVPTVEQLDRALLAKAFRGELVPQDPTDEPAEAMLVRIGRPNGRMSVNGVEPAGKRKQNGRPRRGDGS